MDDVLQTRNSNMRHRPIGIGVQGLADAFILMRFPFDSDEARLLNIQMFETIYYAALEASCELAERDGAYQTYEGSPVSQGVRFLLIFWFCVGFDVHVGRELKGSAPQDGPPSLTEEQSCTR